MIKFSQISQKVIAISQNVTADTRFTVAHGLGYAPALIAIMVQAKSADNDTASTTPAVAVVKVDGTNVTLKCNLTLSPLTATMFIALEEQGPVNFAR